MVGYTKHNVCKECFYRRQVWMKIFREYSKCQGLLVHSSLDEFVPENHEVRVVGLTPFSNFKTVWTLDFGLL